MEVERYQDWSLQLHRRLAADRVPVSGTIEVTRRCPLSCVHCYNNLPVSDHSARRGELTLDEHRRIIDEIAAAGCLWATWSWKSAVYGPKANLSVGWSSSSPPPPSLPILISSLSSVT